MNIFLTLVDYCCKMNFKQLSHSMLSNSIRKKSLLLYIFIFLYTGNGYSQQRALDSLEAVLSHTKEDTVRLNILFKLCDVCEVEDNVKYATLALNLIEKLIAHSKNEKQILELNNKKIIAYQYLLYYYREKKDNKMILEYYRKTLAVLIDLKDEDGIIRSILQIGNAYMDQGNIPKGLEYIDKATLMATQKKNDRQIANCLNVMSYYYQEQWAFPEAIGNLHKSMLIYQKLKDTMNIASTLNYLGTAYCKSNQLNSSLKSLYESKILSEKINYLEGIRGTYNLLGLTYIQLKDYDKAIDCYKKSLKISETWTDKTWIRGILGNIGDVYREKGDIENALVYHFKALEAARLTKMEGQESWEFHRISLDYFQQKKYLLAKNYNDKFLSLSSKEKHTPIYILEEGELMALQIDTAIGKFKQAFYHFQKYILLRDSFKSKEIINASIKAKFQSAYDEKKNQDKIIQNKREIISKAALEKEKLTRNAYAGGGFLLLLLSIVLLRSNRNKQKNNQQLEEKNSIIIKEKKRSDDLLLNILPEEVAEELKQTGEAAAKQFNHVTVLFTDFVNFTGISETLTPTELVENIHKEFTAFDAIIEKYGLEKIKTIGDAYLAVGGLPIERKDHAELVVKAAIEIRDYIEKSNGKFKIRIGINSGPVVAGIVGVKKYAYDIWGDTVNSANRMETNSEPNRINISSSTYELIKDHFKCEYRGKINAKGKGEVDMYFVNESL